MTLAMICWVALGAAIGAPLRYALGWALDHTVPGYPLGTLTANVTGSLLLGAWWGLGLDPAQWSLLAVGFCGGLTTWSTLAVQVIDRRAPGYLLVTVAASLAAFAFGFLATC